MDYQTKQELLVAYHEARHTLEAVQRVLENVLADATIDAEMVEITRTVVANAQAQLDKAHEKFLA